MQDLNDLYYFVQVVDHGGFAPAGRAIGMPKSRLSRRIAQLEERLGVRLLQRSTRQFAVTELGRTYYEHCKAMLVEAEAAQAAIEMTRAEPCGLIRMSCPIALLHTHIGPMLADFMARHPQIRVELEGTNRRGGPPPRGCGVAIRGRPPPPQDSELGIRVLAQRRPGPGGRPAPRAQQGLA
ncbi:LysR family transcriptional regulator, partial [Aeromonas hydrophila]|uniref:LysR family transcriptional regulator n=1 Tax=Aeromonas hydrophila TaxID=644 RepID=UPI003017DCFC